MSTTDLADFLRGYAATMAWANIFATDAAGELADITEAVAVQHADGTWFAEADGYAPAEISTADAIDFYNHNRRDMLATGCADFGQHGHDFALTRNHHGAGFWDRGYGPAGDKLTSAAHVYGEATVDLTPEG